MKAVAYLAGVLGGTSDLLVAIGLRPLRPSADPRRAWSWLTTGVTGLPRRVVAIARSVLPGRRAHFLIALLFCMLVASGYGIVALAEHQILRAEAENKARGWARHLKSDLTDLRQILAGGVASQSSLAALDRVHGSGLIIEFELDDLSGRKRFSSRQQGSEATRWSDAAQVPSAEIVQSHKGHVELTDRRIATADDTTYYAEVSVPIEDDGIAIGVYRFDIDMSDNFRSLQRILANATLSFGLILAVAFGLPGLAYWLRTRQKDRAETQLTFLSNHDALTQLANRGAAMRRLEALLMAAQRGDPGVAVLCMDLDHFKDVNDSLGHEGGDYLLKDVATRLRATLRQGEHVSRAGGDEFIIIQEGVNGPGCAENLAQRLLSSFSPPFLVCGQSLRIGPSIGIALNQGEGASAEVLVKNADLALNAVKAGGRGTFKFFDESMDQQSQRRRVVAEQVRGACDGGGFQLNFQPVFSLATGLLAGFEALVRLPRTEGGMISPAEFVPVAEELGLITKIGAWVLDTACEQAARWPHDLTVAVNISPAEFREGNVVDRVAAALAKSGLKPERLEIEVTEGVLLANTQTTRNTLDGLKRLGVAIVLDDFGTGYSSLSYLWQFPFDKIKIDQSFVRAIGTNDSVSDIIRTIIALGRALDLRVTAEGVETEAQAAVLRAMRCDLVQGFLYGAPVAQPELPAAVMRQLPRSLAASAERESSRSSLELRAG